jgi:hypothetical protein
MTRARAFPVDEFQTNLRAIRETTWSDVPAAVYHYTSLEAALKILESGAFWATNAAFLADPEEIAYTAGLAEAVITSVSRRRRSPVSQAVLSLVRTCLKDRFATANDIYIVCFSARTDAKTIWTGFGNTGGVALGLDTQQLAIPWGAGHILLVPVAYKPVNQRRTLTKVVETALDAVSASAAHADGAELHIISQFVAAEVLAHATRFKKPDFADEQEWRAIYIVRPHRKLKVLQPVLRYPNELDFKDTAFFVRSGQVVPYIPVSLMPRQTDEPRPPITQIICGPRLHDDSTQRALRLAALRYGYHDVKVGSSALKLR